MQRQRRPNKAPAPPEPLVIKPSEYRTIPAPVGPSKDSFWFYHKGTTKTFTMPLEELKEKYAKFLKTQDTGWILERGHLTVTTFVTGVLNASIDVVELLKLETALTKTRHTFYPCNYPKRPKKKPLKKPQRTRRTK